MAPAITAIRLLGEGEEFLNGENLIRTVWPAETTGGAWSAVEYVAAPRAAGPPAHWHRSTSEAFYVREGLLSLQVGEDHVALPPGGSAMVAPGTVHRFWNETDEPVVYLRVFTPGGQEEYLRQLALLKQKATVWPPEDPTELDHLADRFDVHPPETAPKPR